MLLTCRSSSNTRLSSSLLVSFVSILCLAPLQADVTTRQADAPIEMRGILQLSSETQFSLRERSSGQHYWLKLGQERNGLRLDAYDRETQLLTVTYGGQNYKIGLEEASSSPMAFKDSTAEARLALSPVERERNRHRLSISPRRASVAMPQPVKEAGLASSATPDDGSIAAHLARGDKLTENNRHPASGAGPAGQVASLINPMDYPVAPRNVSNLEILAKKNK